MTLKDHRSLTMLALVLVLAIGICNRIGAQETANDEAETTTSDTPDDSEVQSQFDENEAKWRSLDEYAKSVLEHYRSLLEKIPGAMSVSTAVNSTGTGVGILVFTKDAPTQAALHSAPKELDGVEVRVEEAPKVYLVPGVFDTGRKPERPQTNATE
jgi:hypothetical protein